MGASQQRRPHRRAGADGHAELERLAHDARRSAAAGARHLRLLHRGADLHRGQDPLEQLRLLRPGLLDAQQPADAESGRARRRRNDSVVPAREPEPRVRACRTSSRRASASPTTSQGNGKWKAYGSWGMFYDISKLEMPRGAWGADHWIDYHYTLDSFNWPAINCEGPPGSGCPGTFIEQADRRHVSNDPNDNLIDPDLKPIRTQEFTLGLDHELTPTMSVGVRYAHKWLDRTIEDVGIQVAGVGEVFMIANPGYGIAEFTLAATCPTCPAQPKAKRDYDGVEFRLRKRLSNRWSMNTQLHLQQPPRQLLRPDELRRERPQQPERQPVLRRPVHVVRLARRPDRRPAADRSAAPLQVRRVRTTCPGAPWLAWNYRAASGTPQQSTITYKSVPVFDEARGDLGRTPIFTQTDLILQHDFPLPGRTRLNVGSERHQPVRSGHGDAAVPGALPGSRSPASTMPSSSRASTWRRCRP